MKNDKFKFFLPADFEKATDAKGKEIMKISGLASTSEEDSQGEFLDPTGFDLSGFKWINYNHKGSSDPGTIIGEPTKATLNAKKELHIEGILYPEVPMAKTTWNLMKALRNSPSGNRLSLSVEGKVLERASDDKKSPLYNKILRSKITGVAICPVPVNGSTWVDMITKGVVDEEEKEEEYDDETKKAITAAEGEGVTQKESVEHKVKNLLKKSEVFEKIYDKFPGITIEKAKSVYSLIEKTATIMSTENKGAEISDETITKAFDILGLAATSAAETEIEKAEKEKLAKAAKEKEESEVEDDEEKEMVKKASATCKMMKSENKDKEEIKKSLIKKGYGEKVIEKAMKDDDGEKKDGLSKSEIEDLLKSQAESIGKMFGEKFQAVGTILKKVNDENAEIKKSLDNSLEENKELKEQMTNMLSTPNKSKSLIIKSYSDRFGKEEKSEEGKENKKFNILSPKDRVALKDKLTEASGIMKGENYDKGLIDIAQELEISKSLTEGSLRRLSAMEIEVVAE